MAAIRNRYRAIWLSDIHLGSRDCRIEMVHEFLDSIDCETLYLVGDIVDVESMRRRLFWPESHTEALAKLLAFAERGARVIYIPGNHDATFRKLAGVPVGPIEIARDAVHETLDGRRLLVLHGDRFDAVIRSGALARIAGTAGYRALVAMNRLNHWLNHCLGRPYWSLASAVKSKIGGANRYVERFRAACLDAARRGGFDGIVCGHIHKAELIEIGGLLYCNDGDWVESCTALLETRDGRLVLSSAGARAEGSFPAVRTGPLQDAA